MSSASFPSPSCLARDPLKDRSLCSDRFQQRRRSTHVELPCRIRRIFRLLELFPRSFLSSSSWSSFEWSSDGTLSLSWLPALASAESREHPPRTWHRRSVCSSEL